MNNVIVERWTLDERVQQSYVGGRTHLHFCKFVLIQSVPARSSDHKSVVYHTRKNFFFLLRVEFCIYLSSLMRCDTNENASTKTKENINILDESYFGFAVSDYGRRAHFRLDRET